jgi:hypothetical protein
MKKTWLSKSLRALGLTTAAVGGIALLAGSASALVLADKSDPQKLRKDIQKQQSKFVNCLVKAALKCEGTGDQVNPPECDLSDGTAIAPANGKGTFVADIAKCESKVDYTKKSYSSIATDYDDIGCPGDSAPPAPDNPYSDLVAYETGANASAKDQIDTLAAVLAGAAADPGICGTGTADEQNDCGVDLAKVVGNYAKGLFKCLGLCENDYKDKKGNGGGNDAGNCTLDPDGSAPNNSGNLNFNACVDKARGKAEKKGPLPPSIVGVLGLVHVALNDANVDLFNENEVCP